MKKAKKKKPLSYKDFFENQWCPLFGVLPDIPESHQAYKDASIFIGDIRYGREYWEVYHIDIYDGPFPTIAELSVSRYRDYAEERILAARSLFSNLDKLVQKTDFSARQLFPFLGPKQVTGRIMVEVLGNDWILLEEANKFINGSYDINYIELYSLFAIHYCWNTVKDLLIPQETEYTVNISEGYQYVELLLQKVFNYVDAKHTMKLEEELSIEKNKPSLRGKKGGSKNKKSFALRAAINKILDQMGESTSAARIWQHLERHHFGEEKAMVVVGENNQKYKIWIQEDTEEIEDKIDQMPYDSEKKPIGRRSLDRYLKFVREERLKIISQ